MPTIYEATNIDETVPTGTQSADVIAISGKHVVPTTVTLGADDTINLVKLPANHVPVDFILDTMDLDSDGTPAIVVHVGFANCDTGSDDDADAFIASSTVGQAGGIARAAAIGFSRIAAVDRDRMIAVTVATAADAAPPASATVAGTLLCRPQNGGRDR
jgi:hypothetical protein